MVQQTVKKSKIRNKKRKKIPCVATSDEWLAHFAKQEDEKTRLEQEKKKKEKKRITTKKRRGM